jgi:hypothetical protein
MLLGRRPVSAVETTIDAGVCGFVTRVRATADSDAMVRFEIDSPCANIQGLAVRLPAVDAYAEIGAGFEGEVLRTARASLKACCSGCVVPNGIFKGMQIAAGLALPRDISMGFERVEEKT